MQLESVDMDDCWNKIGVWGQVDSRCKRLEDFVHCHNCPVYSRAARCLLDRMPPEDYVREWTEFLARPKEIDMSGSRSVFVFRIGGEWLAFPFSIIREVTAMGRIHKIPHRNSSLLRGLVNIRGKLELSVSVGMTLGIKSTDRKNKSSGFQDHERLVAVEKEGYCVVFPVSEIRGIVRYNPEDMSAPPTSVTGSKDVYSRGILRLDDTEISIIDEELFFDTVKRGMV